MMRPGWWLLAASLLITASAAAAAAQDAFCAGVVKEAGSGEAGAWQWLGDQDLPPEVLNATLAAFDDRFLYGPAPGEEAWVPCSEQELMATVDGCVQDGEDALAYQLRVNLTCVHAEHTDAAAFDALVTLGADGGIQVNFSSVVLQVDASHFSDQPCDDPLCALCRPGPPPAAGQPPLPQACDMCLLDFKVNSATGRCQEAPSIPEAGEAAIQGASPAPASDTKPAYSPTPYVPASAGSQPAGDASTAREEWFNQYCAADPANCKQVDPREIPSKPCGQGWFIIAQESATSFWCSRCNRPGCQDCARCYGDKTGCRNDQFCLAPCQAGSMWVLGSCLPCSELIAGCDLCERCTLGRNAALNKGCQTRPGAWSGVRCLRCKHWLGWAWMGDGTARCKPLR